MLKLQSVPYTMQCIEYVQVVNDSKDPYQVWILTAVDTSTLSSHACQHSPAVPDNALLLTHKSKHSN